jgi:hypothetical protein
MHMDWAYLALCLVLAAMILFTVAYVTLNTKGK